MKSHGNKVNAINISSNVYSAIFQLLDLLTIDLNHFLEVKLQTRISATYPKSECISSLSSFPVYNIRLVGN